MLKRTAGMVITMLACACCSAGTPAGLGVKDGRLAPCPSSPNCVSSQAEDPRHAMDPIPYDTPRDRAREKMMRVVLDMPRTKIVTGSGDYIHAEFRSRVWRFVDDVEFFFDDDRKLIEFRSASRLGHSDLGANRKRMEEVRRRFESASD